MLVCYTLGVAAIQSTLLIPVLNAEPIVGKWRKQYHSSALRGIPTHITLLFPFLNPQLITESVINDLSSQFKKIRAFQFSLIKIGTFPNVIYLEPFPCEPFIELTKNLVAEYSDLQPYDGIYKSINPHVTLAMLSATNDFSNILKAIETDIFHELPIQSIAKEAWLMEKDIDNYWHIKIKFPFAEV